MEPSIVVLLITVVFIISLILNKWSFGVTGLTTVALLFLFYYEGNVSKAFSGMTNKVMIMIAGMYVVSAAFARTSFLTKLRGMFGKIEGKSGFALVLCIYGVAFLFGNFFPGAVTTSLMVVFCATLGDDNYVSNARMIIPCCAMGCMAGVLPIGNQLVAFAAYNAYYEGLVTSQSQLLTMWEPIKYKLIPFAFGLVWCLIAWKFLPQRGMEDQGGVSESNGAEKKQKTSSKKPLEPWQEKIVYAVFLSVIVALFFTSKIGNYAYGVPLLAALVLLYTKALPRDEINGAATSSIAWMIVGILSLSDALGTSGAGNLIGETLLGMLGPNIGMTGALIFFGVATMIVTSLMSNLATQAVFVPIAAATFIAAGWSPQPVVITISYLSWCAIMLPSGSAASAMAHASSRLPLSKTFVFTVPYAILVLIGCVISQILFFPA